LRQKPLDSAAWENQTYVERFEKTTKKDAQAQIQKAAQTPKVSSPQKLSRQLGRGHVTGGFLG
jgi:hypothetical protein